MRTIFAFCLLLLVLALTSTYGQIKPAHIRHFTIYGSRSEYCAWPSLVRAANGDLLVTFCQSEEHLGPDGRILLMRSSDHGETWQGPELVYNSVLDDRECGLTVLRDGRILAHLWSTLFTPDYYRALSADSYEADVLARWIEWVQRADYVQADELKGGWVSTSNDHGHTWSGLTPGPDTVHGGIQLADGSLLVAPYRKQGDHIAVFHSDSTAARWQELAMLYSPHTETIRFGEPHMLELPSGRILMMIRATSIPYNDKNDSCLLWESYSDDGGRTWVPPFQTPLWGFPPHLALLSDGRILCTYGHRRPPYGERACISRDGVTWLKKDEIILRDDAPNGDLGYPASIELGPGRILTVYYQTDASEKQQRMHPPDPLRWKPDIQGTIWRF